MRRVALQEAQLAKCKEQLGGVLPEVSIDESKISFKRRPSVHSYSPSPSSSSTIDPRASLSCVTPATSPETSPYIKLEDSMPGSIQDEASLFDSFDLTQHSAAMLCDLQCRSNGSSKTSLPSPQSILQTWFWTRIILFLVQTSILNLYRTTLLALWTHSPTRMNNLLETLVRGSTSTAPRQRLTTRSPTPPPSWLTLAQHFLLATGHSTQGSSAIALSGVRESEESPAARSFGRSLDEGFLGGSFGRKGIGHQERENEHEHDKIKTLDAPIGGGLTDMESGGPKLPRD